MNERKWNAIITGIALGAIFVLVTYLAHASDVLRTDNTSIRMDTERQITALWVSFYDYDSTGLMFGGVERGADCPPAWSFTVHRNVPGVTYVSVIAPCTVEYVTGQGLEIARLGQCGVGVASEPALSGLLTTENISVTTSCSGCCCEPTLLVESGADCPTDVPPPPTWSDVKQLFQ